MNGNKTNTPATATSGSSATDSSRGAPASRVSREGVSRVLDPGVASRLNAIPDPDQDLVQAPVTVEAHQKAPVVEAVSERSDTGESVRHAAVASLAAGEPLERAVRAGFSGISHSESAVANQVADIEIEDFGRKHALIDAIINLITFRWLLNFFRGSRKQELAELREKVSKLSEETYENEARLGDLGKMIADQRLSMESRIRAIVQETSPDLTPMFSRLTAMESWSKDVTTKLESVARLLESSPQIQASTPDSGELKALQERIRELDASIAGLTAEMRREASEKVSALRATMDEAFAKLYQTDLQIWFEAQIAPMISKKLKTRQSLPPLDGDVAEDVYAQLEMMGDDLEKFENRLNANEPHMLSIMRLGHALEGRLKHGSENGETAFASGRTMIETPLPESLRKPAIADQLAHSGTNVLESQPETATRSDLESEFMNKSINTESAELTQEQLDSEFANKQKIEAQPLKVEVSAQTETPVTDKSEKATVARISDEMTDEEFAEMAGLRSHWSLTAKLSVAALAVAIFLIGFVGVARSSWFQNMASGMRQSTTVDGGASVNVEAKPPLQRATEGDPSAASRDGGVGYPLTGKTNLNSSERLRKSQQSVTPNADPSAIKPDKDKGIFNEPKKKALERKLDRLREKQSRADQEIVKDYSKLGSVEEALKKFQRDLQDELSGKKEEEPVRDLTPPVIRPKWNQPTVATQTIAIPNDKHQSPCRLILHEGEANEECIR